MGDLFDDIRIETAICCGVTCRSGDTSVVCSVPCVNFPTRSGTTERNNESRSRGARGTVDTDSWTGVSNLQDVESVGPGFCVVSHTGSTGYPHIDPTRTDYVRQHRKGLTRRLSKRRQMASLVVVGHGSHLNPNSDKPVFDHADRIRATGAFDDVREAFWKEEPSPREVLRTVTSDEVFVVPVFMSEGYFTEQVIPRELRLRGWTPTTWDSDGTDASHATLRAGDTGQTVHYCGPIGTHDAMSDVIVRRAESVTGDETVGRGVGLAVVGHGTKRNENSAKAVTYHADRIRERNRFADVRALFMDEDPEVDDLTDHFESEDIVLVPLFLADGYHTQEDIPEDVGLTADYRDGWDVPATVDSHKVWYAGAVGTEPLLARVIAERAADAGAPIDPDAVDATLPQEGKNEPKQVGDR